MSFFFTYLARKIFRPSVNIYGDMLDVRAETRVGLHTKLWSLGERNEYWNEWPEVSRSPPPPQYKNFVKNHFGLFSFGNRTCGKQHYLGQVNRLVFATACIELLLTAF
jgi:hypothetical protein